MLYFYVSNCAKNVYELSKKNQNWYELLIGLFNSLFFLKLTLYVKYIALYNQCTFQRYLQCLSSEKLYFVKFALFQICTFKMTLC